MNTASIVGWVKSVVGTSGPTEIEVTGTILEKPILHMPAPSGGHSSPDSLTFRLDSRPDLVFHQQLSRALVPERKQGDKVKVFCHVEGDGTATVRWVSSV